MQSCEKQNKKETKKKRQKNKEIVYSKLDEAIKESKYNYTTFAKRIDVNKSTVSSWCMGSYAPSEENLQKIVKVLNEGRMLENKPLYDIPYFRGDIDQPNIESHFLYTTLGINNESIKTLKEVKSEQDFFKTNNSAKLQNEYLIYENGYTYSDVIDYIISDKEFLNTILYEAERVMTFYSSDIYREKFDIAWNDNNFVPTPNIVEIERISNSIIYEAISKSFNNYITSKLKEKGIEKLSYSDFQEKLLKKQMDDLKN